MVDYMYEALCPVCDNQLFLQVIVDVEYDDKVDVELVNEVAHTRCNLDSNEDYKKLLSNIVKYHAE